MLRDKLRRRKKPKGPKVPRGHFLNLRPVRNPEIEWKKRESGEVTIMIPRRKSRSTNFLSKLFSVPEKKQVELDGVGSDVWDLCDGKRTVKEIAQVLHQDYKLTMDEAETSLKTYFDQLMKRRLVGFMVPEETRARFLKEFEKKKKT